MSSTTTRTAESARRATLSVRSKNRAPLEAGMEILEAERPMTLRQLFYRLVSAGVLANRQSEYKRLGNLMTRAREVGDIPRTWIVDHVRNTLKPSSWSGVADFADSVRECYRKDFWASLPDHVEVFVEKDAVAGTIQPVTIQYDIALRVCRGYSSVSFAGEIADLWAQVGKPIFAYYLGDFDPSGFDLERDLREKLERYSGRDVWACHSDIGLDENPRTFAEIGVVYWHRLGVVASDFGDHDLIELPVKPSDMRAAGFLKDHGERCAEIDAIPPTELRRRVTDAIERHIDQRRWRRLQRVEAAEQETINRVADQLGAVA
jgi:hypothetical protein